MKIVNIILISSILIVSNCSATAAEAPQPPLDVLVTVRNLMESSSFLDELLLDHPETILVLPSVLLEGILQETKWVDSSRQVVVGIRYRKRENPADIFVLIPFLFEHPAFSDLYEPKIIENSYILTLPPGQTETMNRAVTSELLNASRSRPKGYMHMVVRAGQVAVANGRKGGLPPNSPLDLAPIAKQIETVSLGFETGASHIRFFAKLIPVKNSELHTFIGSISNNASRPFGSAMTHAFTLETGDFDLASFFRIMGSAGIDIDGIAEIVDHLSGAFQIGATLPNDQVDFDATAVFKSGKSRKDFIETILIPEILKQETRLIRTRHTVVDNRRVYGVGPEEPISFFLPMPATATPLPVPEIRMTQRDRLLVCASSDANLKTRIKDLDIETGKLDDSSYALSIRADIESLAKILFPGAGYPNPEAPPSDPPGSMAFHSRMEGGAVNTDGVISIEGLKHLVSAWILANTRQPDPASAPALETDAPLEKNPATKKQ